jgi:hypothetical protein
LVFLYSIRGKPLQRWLFNLTLEEGALDIILYIHVRWLSRYKFLQRFCSLLSEIKTFLKERGDEKAELEDEDLAFLADFRGKLSDMNKCIAKMMSSFILQKQIRAND